MASTASATAAAAAAAFGAAAKPRGSSSAPCARVAAGGRRRSGVVVRCDAGVEAQVQAVAKAASIAALEQFKISADRECLALKSAAAVTFPVTLGCLGLCRPGELIHGSFASLPNYCCCIICVASKLLLLQLGLVLVGYRSKRWGWFGEEKE